MHQSIKNPRSRAEIAALFAFAILTALLSAFLVSASGPSYLQLLGLSALFAGLHAILALPLLRHHRLPIRLGCAVLTVPLALLLGLNLPRFISVFGKALFGQAP